MIDANVTDPLFQFISKTQESCRKKIEAFRRQEKLIEPGDMFEFNRFVNVLLGSKLQHEQTYLLDPSTSWISTIHSCSRLGMIRCVCKNFSNDLNLMKMDKRTEDRLNIAILRIKGKGCHKKPAVGVCFMENEVSRILPEYVLTNEHCLVPFDEILTPGVLGCGCVVEEEVAGEGIGITQSQQGIVLKNEIDDTAEEGIEISLVTEGICIESEIDERAIRTIGLPCAPETGKQFGVALFMKKKTELTTLPESHLHERILSLMRLRHLTMAALWNKSGPEGYALKDAVIQEFRNGRNKRRKLLGMSKKSQTSTYLQFSKGSPSYLQLIATKNLLTSNTRQILGLMPAASFFSGFLNDLKSYFEWLELQRFDK